MRTHSPFVPVFGFILCFSSALAQTPDPASQTRPRRVSPPKQSQPATQAVDLGENTSDQPSKASAVSSPAGGSSEQATSPGSNRISSVFVRSRISEAERLLKSRPVPTAMPSQAIEFVTVAALDRTTSRIHLVTLAKQTFLTKGAEVNLTSSEGTLMNVQILRANGVNTALTISDGTGRALLPLVVEFPIEKGGVFREMAYYTSAHPALLSGDLVQSGKTYVRGMLDLAAKRLREKGVFVSPQIVNVAERLCVVEHIDHDRFRAENRLALFDEIYSLYALNELDTYRYSVSFAGAGGMVQMIPWAYSLMRQRHPGVGLIPDFVVGMRNHSNALQAMLLYMQDTWNDLAANTDVKAALDSKTATPAELLAAGYNSNAARLPLYLRRGGDSWRTLIPRETQTYLQIYKTFEGLVPVKPTAAEPAGAGK